MADGISTSGLTKMTGVENLDTRRNYFLVDSDERDLTGRIEFTDFINVMLSQIANRLNDSGLIPHIEVGVSLEDVKRALLDNRGDFILDEDGNLITDSSRS